MALPVTAMKRKPIILAITLLAGVCEGFSQGFANLNFESADFSGYSSGTFNSIPMNQAFPGWNGFYISSSSTNVASMASYNVLPLSTAAISIGDTNLMPYFGPLQGSYSAFLFGANGYASKISQTGLVPLGTQSFLMDVADVTGIYGGSFTILIGDQVINMTALQVFPSYTLYGGDVSSFSGQTVNLSIIVPPMANPNDPNGWEFDLINFSTDPVPEPSAFAMSVIGGAYFVWRLWKATGSRAGAA